MLKNIKVLTEREAFVGGMIHNIYIDDVFIADIKKEDNGNWRLSTNPLGPEQMQLVSAIFRFITGIR